MPLSASQFVRYSQSVEAPAPDEQETFEKINEVFAGLSEMMLDRFRHAFRTVHAKSHGLLLGDLVIPDDLPEPLKQGLFSRGRTHPAVLRFSTNPGDVLADSVSTPRGLGLKILEVDGPRVDGQTEQTQAQDFVLAIGPTFPVADAKGFLGQEKLIAANANDPEPFKKVVSAGARAINAVLGTVGMQSPAVAGLGYEPTHPLGETYFSQAPLRFGDYIAKVCVRPKSDNLKQLLKHNLAVAFHYSALRDAIVEFFKTETAEWELCAQLCTDLEKMPIEDATVEWKESLSPYLPVGTIIVKPQEAYSNERRVYVDDKLSFAPWNCLEAHRPLGSIMRSRKSAYAQSVKLRMAGNAVCPMHPKNRTEIPA